MIKINNKIAKLFSILLVLIISLITLSGCSKPDSYELDLMYKIEVLDTEDANKQILKYEITAVNRTSQDYSVSSLRLVATADNKATIDLPDEIYAKNHSIGKAIGYLYVNDAFDEYELAYYDAKMISPFISYSYVVYPVLAFVILLLIMHLIGIVSLNYDMAHLRESLKVILLSVGLGVLAPAIVAMIILKIMEKSYMYGLIPLIAGGLFFVGIFINHFIARLIRRAQEKGSINKGALPKDRVSYITSSYILNFDLNGHINKEGFMTNVTTKEACRPINYYFKNNIVSELNHQIVILDVDVIDRLDQLFNSIELKIIPVKCSELMGFKPDEILSLLAYNIKLISLDGSGVNNRLLFYFEDVDLLLSKEMRNALNKLIEISFNSYKNGSKVALLAYISNDKRREL